jgi:hypothetical protein
MKRAALEFVVDASQAALVTQTLRETAGEALAHLTLATIDGIPRYRITALIERRLTALAMKAVMNVLDKSG